MRIKIGKFCIILGTALILGALGLFLWNDNESNEAESYSLEVLPQIYQEVQEAQKVISEVPDVIPVTPVEYLTEEDRTMTEVEIEGNFYIGYLSIPALGLELPVMTDWSYPKLRIAPCRYSGTLRGKDLVIMAHNYKSHFGGLSKLPAGSEVIFTDMDGNIWTYEAIGIDILEATSVEEMTAGDYDLTLFTCTQGGSHRVTLRCDLIS